MFNSYTISLKSPVHQITKHAGYLKTLTIAWHWHWELWDIVWSQSRMPKWPQAPWQTTNDCKNKKGISKRANMSLSLSSRREMTANDCGTAATNVNFKNSIRIYHEYPRWFERRENVVLFTTWTLRVIQFLIINNIQLIFYGRP